MPFPALARAMPCLLLLALSAGARGEVQVGAVELERTSGVYHVEARIEVAAGDSAVRQVLAEPRLLPQLNPRVTSVVLLGQAADSGERVLLRSRRCFLMFCQSYRWIQSMRIADGGDVLVHFEEGEGALGGSAIRYRIEPASGVRTRVHVSARLVPGVELPPVVGPALLRHALVEDVRDWARGIDRLAGNAATTVR